MTQKYSMQVASPVVEALMFGDGEIAATVVSLLAALYAWPSGTPRGNVLFWVMAQGDYAKVLRALRSNST